MHGFPIAGNDAVVEVHEAATKIQRSTRRRHSARQQRLKVELPLNGRDARALAVVHPPVLDPETTTPHELWVAKALHSLHSVTAATINLATPVVATTAKETPPSALAIVEEAEPDDPKPEPEAEPTPPPSSTVARMPMKTVRAELKKRGLDCIDSRDVLRARLTNAMEKEEVHLSNP